MRKRLWNRPNCFIESFLSSMQYQLIFRFIFQKKVYRNATLVDEWNKKVSYRFFILVTPRTNSVANQDVENWSEIWARVDRVWPSHFFKLFWKVERKMSWYCIEERNDSLKQFGRFQRRFLTEESYSLPNTQITHNQQSVSSLIFIAKYLDHFSQTKNINICLHYK